MKKSNVLFIGLLFFFSITAVLAQDYTRKVVEVPKVDSGAVTIDGVMDESVWDNAAHADLITNTGYEIFANKYERESLTEPEFDELYGRMLWSKDTLYLFIHIDEFVNDSTDLFWLTDNDTWWGGDQLFVSLSNRLGVNMTGDYHGNVYAAPDGPYHFLILGDQVTLNGDDTTFIPEEFRGSCQDDSLNAFLASNIARYAVTIDSANGVWDIEMAIYNPNVNANAKIGFNLGGSTGSSVAYDNIGDAYGYYTWQPNISNDPFGDPFGNGDPGFFNLANSDYWALLKFQPGPEDIIRKEVDVPMVDSGAVTIDGVMDESVWDNAAHADLITNTGYEIFANKYERESLTEPEFDELYGRMLWSKDTLYLFIHIDEFVNDSTDLFWLTDNDTWWGGDQLFVSLSNRLGVNMSGDYHGNVYAAPDGPYHFLVLGDSVTLNGGIPTFVPEEYQKCFDNSDSLQVFQASNISKYAVTIDSANGVWDIEMAVYNPSVALQSSIGFNLGGSTGSSVAYDNIGDAYGYYTWQPNISNDPFGDPFGNGDPGFFNLADASYWALLNFVSGTTGIREETGFTNVPSSFKLMQNFPNPFNPSTTIRFQISQASPVTLKIYNTLGQVVATLVDGKPLTAGTYSVDWDASQFASGVYFYELKADNVVQSKKMILLK